MHIYLSDYLPNALKARMFVSVCFDLLWTKFLQHQDSQTSSLPLDNVVKSSCFSVVVFANIVCCVRVTTVEVSVRVCLCDGQVFIFTVDNKMLRVVSEVSGKEVRSHLALASSIQNNVILST